MTSSNLTLVETVTSAKLANKINSQVKQGTVGVFVQVTTSNLQKELVFKIYLSGEHFW